MKKLTEYQSPAKQEAKQEAKLEALISDAKVRLLQNTKAIAY